MLKFDRDTEMLIGKNTTGKDLFEFASDVMSFSEVMELYKHLNNMVVGLYGTIEK